ncbi:hypothetical protein D8674_020223 [Pyrus ussuriensis x Pyrus communis]|uniref:BSD domain-containing protein n=1 Tax=Pyrus ussuriensis x Pyrus communis TaxID=2448454 RepID=A0A5N5HFH7_9ROSA|nr:hypothetical protein D8674_020223 [Pyrus ussuriensis x Pyrus communis]
MSWLAKSIANSLKLNDDDGDYHGPNPSSNNDTDPNSTRPESGSPSAPTVKGDISELTNTLTRQFWGVASFLAPPPDPTTPPAPNPSDPAHPSDLEPSDEDVIAGIRSDFAEIGGKFKTGISKLSSNIGVSEFTKIASNLLQFGSEEEAKAAGAALGVTQEVLAFVRNISLHPETWLDFPLSDDDEDSDDFELSDVQQEHALAVERLAPSLAALRIELCPEHMSEAHFWMIYFVLLHPRLSKHDAELLSTPKIVEARGMLSHQLKKGTSDKPETYISGSDAIYAKGVSDSPKEHHLSVPPSAESDLAPPNTSTTRSAPLPQAVDVETDKHPVQSSEIQIIDKPVIEEGPVKKTKYQLPFSNSSSKVVDEKYEDDGDDWLKEETSEMDGVGGTSIPIENDEDVSFSDLEDDDGDAPSSYKKVTSGSDSSAKDSRDWVQLSRASADLNRDSNSVEIRHSGSGQVSARKSETKESNDWLDIEDIDVI